ncbi:MAG: DUF805 domain-containing protein [Muribaculaceae bacterium]|nr:DUF805 domain-containing protein [Muribaculaceae bacterium]
MEQNQNPQPPGFNPQPQYNQPQYNQPQYNQPQYQYQYPQPEPMMPFWTAVKTCFRKYFDFTGRARRSEYWWFALFYVLVTFVWLMVCAFFTVLGLDTIIHGVGSPISVLIISGVFTSLPVFFFIIPQYAAMTRRLHDTGHSGWWVLAAVLVGIAYIASYFALIIPLVSGFDSGSSALDELMSSPMMPVVGILGLASMVLGIVIFVFTLLDSERGENKYGPSPKYQ